jgi:hypothetical protein
VAILHFDGRVDEIIQTDHRIEDVVVGFDGNIATANKPISYAILAPLQQENRFDLVIYDQTSASFSIVDADGEVLQSFTPAAVPTGQFAMADLDGNATPDILFNGADGIYAYNQGGFPVSGFPIRPTLAPMDTLIGTPLLCDVNRDNVTDIIVATRLGQVMAFTLNGQSIADYQLATGGQMSTSPMIVSWDDASGLELVALSNSGTLYAWQLPTEAGDPNNLWLQADLNGSNNAVLPVFAPYRPLSESLMPVNGSLIIPIPMKTALRRFVITSMKPLRSPSAYLIRPVPWSIALMVPERRVWIMRCPGMCVLWPPVSISARWKPVRNPVRKPGSSKSWWFIKQVNPC